MLELVDILTPLITLVGFGAVIFNLSNSAKNNKRIDEKEVELRATAQAEVTLTMREMSNDIKTIMTKMDKTDERLDDVNERLFILESAKRENIRDHEILHNEIKMMKEDSKNFMRVQ